MLSFIQMRTLSLPLVTALLSEHLVQQAKHGLKYRQGQAPVRQLAQLPQLPALLKLDQLTPINM